MQVKSFAKINWILKVLGRRPDAFHEVSTVLQTVGLADRISFELIPSDRIELTTAGYEVALGETNLAHRAACLLKREFSIRDRDQDLSRETDSRWGPVWVEALPMPRWSCSD